MVINRTDEDIHVVFSLEARDLFRASMDLAKFRLLLGFGISLSLVSGLVALFLWLDEKVILLQTSPLFIGIPLVAVGGQVLRLHAACRKYVSSLEQGRRRLQYSFAAKGEGFDVIWGKSSSYVSWDEVFKVVERPNYFQIFLTRLDVRAVPKRAFAKNEEITLLRKIFKSKLGRRATLSLTSTN